MSKQTLLCLAVLSVLITSNANAEDEERDAVLALMDQAFEAVNSSNPDDMRAILLLLFGASMNSGLTENFRTVVSTLSIL